MQIECFRVCISADGSEVTVEGSQRQVEGIASAAAQSDPSTGPLPELWTWWPTRHLNSQMETIPPEELGWVSFLAQDLAQQEFYHAVHHGFYSRLKYLKTCKISYNTGVIMKKKVDVWSEPSLIICVCVRACGGVIGGVARDVAAV